MKYLAQELPLSLPQTNPESVPTVFVPETSIEWVRRRLLVGATALQAGESLGLSADVSMELASRALDTYFDSDAVAQSQTLRLLEALALSHTVEHEIPSVASTADVVNLEEFKRDHPAQTAPVRTPRRTPAKRKQRRPKAEPRFLAPQKGLSDHELADQFFSTEIGPRTQELTALADELNDNLVVNEDERVPEDAARSLVLLVRTMNVYSESDDPRLVTLRKQTDDLFSRYVESTSHYIRKVVVGLAHERSILAIEDLMNEGKLGLIHAFQKFDLGWTSKQVLTYCANRIRGAAIGAVRAEASIIRQPRSVHRTIRELRDGINMGKSREDVAEELDISLEKLDEIEAGHTLTSAVSLDALVDSDDPYSDTFGAIALKDVQAEEVESQLFGDGDVAHEVNLRRIIERLPAAHKKVIAEYFGFTDGEICKTSAQLAAEMGLTESRISQLRTAALDKIFANLPTAVKGSHSARPTKTANAAQDTVS